MFTVSILARYSTQNFSQNNQTKNKQTNKQTKGIGIGVKEDKHSLYTDDNILYKDPQNPPKDTYNKYTI